MQQKIKNLDTKKNEYEAEIENIEHTIKLNNEKLKRVEFENSLLNDKYNSLVKILKLNGVIMYIENKNFNVKEWDNLNFIKQQNFISIKTKDEEIIYTFDNINSRVLNKLLYENNSYSIVIMRVTEQSIKINIRIK